jgi:hypothetical protein
MPGGSVLIRNPKSAFRNRQSSIRNFSRHGGPFFRLMPGRQHLHTLPLQKASMVKKSGVPLEQGHRRGHYEGVRLPCSKPGEIRSLHSLTKFGTCLHSPGLDRHRVCGGFNHPISATSNYPMRRMLLALLSALSFGASAQITVTSATFPIAGDTLFYALDFDPAGINAATPPGGNQLWDFQNLQAEETDEIVYRPASAGMDVGAFPTAELVVIGTDGETYYNVTANKFELLGYTGASDASFGVDIIAKFQPPFAERHAPLAFFDIFQQSTNLTLPFSTEDLPDSLLQGAPFVPDSVRVRLTSQRLDVVDGWGTVIIPGGQYPSLRLKRTEYRTTAIDVLVPLIGWIDVSQLGGGGLGNFVGTDTTVSLRFISGTEKEEIAVATLANDQATVERVRFKNNLTSPVIETSAPGSANVQAFPNPAVEWVRFDCTNLPADEYTLKIFNIIGKEIWKETHKIAGNKSIRIELEDFKKGTYLYSLVDRRGKVIGTKRLVVLKP